MITVYTLPSCPQCKLTTRWLYRAGADYRTVDLTTSPDDHNAVTALGYRQAPVICTDDDHWSGFQPHKLMRAINTRKAG